MYLDKAKEQFQKLLQKRSRNGAERGDVYPCTADEVQSLEEHLKLALPEAYKEFLLWTGNGGGFLASEEFDIGRVKDQNRASADWIMKFYNHPQLLPEDAIVFLVYQSVNTFLFIRASEGNDPPVHSFGEQETGNQMVWNYHANLEGLCLETINSQLGLPKGDR